MNGLKWFASEFLVVVAGILVALGLQAWWQNRQDASRRAEYQQQILADVRATERTLRESIEIDRAHYSAMSRQRADEQFRTAQQWRLFAYSSIEYYNQEMLAATTQLRKGLEASAP